MNSSSTLVPGPSGCESPGQRILCIVNPTAGAGQAEAKWESFKTQLLDAKARIDQVYTTAPGDATTLARHSAPDYDLVVAVGGDGTVSEVAHGILTARQNRAVLAIVPLGTGNDVAEALGIGGPTEALQSLTTGRSKPIDVINVQCQSDERLVQGHALLFAGAGIISETLKRTTPAWKRVLGQRWSYPIGLARALMSYRSPVMRVTFENETIEQPFLFVGASNTEIAGGGMRIAPGAQLDDGLLNVNLVEALGRWRALMQLRRLCRGQHINQPGIRYLLARTVQIQSASPLEIAADGDIIGTTPARIEVLPKALRVRIGCT